MSTAFDSLARELNSAPPTRKIRQMLERTDLPADVKALLFELADITVTVGGKILAIGRKLLDFALSLLRAFPGIALGIIVAYVLAGVIDGIPLLGKLLRPIMGPLLLAMGIAMGALKDFTADDFRARVDGFIDAFRALTEA